MFYYGLSRESTNAAFSFLGRLCELLLLLQVNRQQDAVGKLRELTDSFFQEWLCSNLVYLVDQNSCLTQLGKVSVCGSCCKIEADSLCY